MKAALYRRTGGSDVLKVEEIPTPAPGPGQVRVRVALSGVNPTDWKARSGATARPFAGSEGFQVPHHDGVGVIDAVGAGVGAERLGQRVWTYLAAHGNAYGTAAQYSIVPAGRAVPLPRDVPDELAASLGVPALTAAHCLGDEPAAVRGGTVLVAGGAGAVGHFAIELAKHAGARVVTTVSSDEKAALARSAGADLVVNYRSPTVAEEVKQFVPVVDRVVEVALGANIDLDLALSGPRTEIVVYASEPSDPLLPTRRLMTANAALRFVLLYGVPGAQLAACVSWVGDALAAGALSALPAHRFPLASVAEAQDAVEANVVGKVLVEPPD
ncbi:MAG TPA: NADPH:quinone reductase [Acidimicrobiales bacterium]|nr:NADPH:quinone reductase [Acidimicrobiales bacterium]